MQNKINAYTCDNLHSTVTIDREEGTTPMFIRCPQCESKGLQALATSRMYKVNQALPPTYEWYKPSAEELKDMKADMGPAYDGLLEHIKNGGLLKRLIKEDVAASGPFDQSDMD